MIPELCPHVWNYSHKKAVPIDELKVTPWKGDRPIPDAGYVVKVMYRCMKCGKLKPYEEIEDEKAN